VQSAGAGELPLQRARLGAGQERETIDAVGRALGGQRFDPRELALIAGDDELAAAPMRNVTRGAESVEPAIALDA
jgi:hypothetical protein